MRRPPETLPVVPGPAELPSLPVGGMGAELVAPCCGLVAEFPMLFWGRGRVIVGLLGEGALGEAAVPLAAPEEDIEPPLDDALCAQAAPAARQPIMTRDGRVHRMRDLLQSFARSTHGGQDVSGSAPPHHKADRTIRIEQPPLGWLQPRLDQ